MRPHALSLFCGLVLVVFCFTPLPAQVDPIPPTQADWTLDGDQALAAMGTRVVGAGDVNGDGYADLIVSAPGFDGSFADQGIVLLFLGSPAGPSLTPDWSFSGATASARLQGQGAGDINGDGFDDVLLSDGRLFFGSPAGIDGTFQQTEVPGGLTGDVDADGFGDIIRGGDLHFGSPSGLSSPPAPVKTLPNSTSMVLSDLTGDGHADLVVGTYAWDHRLPETLGTCELHLFRGRHFGMSKNEARFTQQTWFDNIPILAAGGDVNGDGYGDLLMGHLVDAAAGPHFFEPVYFFAGSNEGFEPTEGSFYVTGTDPLHGTGIAGDVDGDGHDDVLIVDEELGRRRLAVLAGGPDGPMGPPVSLWGSDISADGFAMSVAAAGDVNGDGYEDLIVGSPFFSDDQAGEGRVSLFLGKPDWFVIP